MQENFQFKCEDIDCIDHAVNSYVELDKLKNKNDVLKYFNKKYEKDVKLECLYQHAKNLEEDIGFDDVYSFLTRDVYGDEFGEDCAEMICDDVYSYCY